MAPRDPNRIKAADLSDSEVLYTVDDCMAHGVFITDAFPHVPGKVVVAKLRKLQHRGWVIVGPNGYQVTAKGREAMSA